MSFSTQNLHVAQSVDGDVTTFAWDWASGIPEMLSDGENLYLVGHDTLAWWGGDEPALSGVEGWAYYLSDALGSVRQEADTTGVVTGNREWTPYRVKVGSAQAGLGYTGEWWDATVGLQYRNRVASCSQPKALQTT